MTTLILIRHGDVPGITPPRFRGRTDLALTEYGIRQAEATRDAIAARWTPVAIYSSPLARCVHTARIIGQAFQLPPVTHAGLVDLDYGEWTGLGRDEVTARWPDALSRWQQSPQTLRFPSGEMLADVLARAVDALDTMTRKHPHETVVLVAHDSVNRVLLSHALGMPLGHYRRLAQHPCGISVLEAVEGCFKVRCVNTTQHLLALQSEARP